MIPRSLKWKQSDRPGSLEIFLILENFCLTKIKKIKTIYKF